MAAVFGDPLIGGGSWILIDATPEESSPDSERRAHLWQISTAHVVGLDFASAGGDHEITPQRYSFLAQRRLN